MGIDSFWSADTTDRKWTNGFVEHAYNGTDAAYSYAYMNIESSDHLETTFDATGDTGDQMVAGLFVFIDAGK